MLAIEYTLDVCLLRAGEVFATHIILGICSFYQRCSGRHSDSRNWCVRPNTGLLNADIHVAFRLTSRRLQSMSLKVEGNHPSLVIYIYILSIVSDGMPPHSGFAVFDSADRVRCMPETRLDIIAKINKWIETGCADDTEGFSQIFWVNGGGGTGKTTIVYTIAEDCYEQGILGANFFCSRDKAECSNPKLIFTTIAYQLSYFCPAFGQKVRLAVQAEPDIGYKALLPVREADCRTPSCSGG